MGQSEGLPEPEPPEEPEEPPEEAGVVGAALEVVATFELVADAFVDAASVVDAVFFVDAAFVVDVRFVVGIDVGLLSLLSSSLVSVLSSVVGVGAATEESEMVRVRVDNLEVGVEAVSISVLGLEITTWSARGD